MDIKIKTNISKQYQDIEILINAPERNQEVQVIENKLLTMTSKKMSQVIGLQNNDIFILNIDNIIMFYSEEKNNYCKTTEGVYRIKEKMYFLEENLSHKDFVRISNSAIINIKFVKCFNTSIVGRILVKFKDGSEEYVSKRRTSEMMKFLKDRSE